MTRDEATGWSRSQEDGDVEREVVESGPDAASISSPFDPELIDIVTKPMTIDLVLARIETAAIDLQPEFQRLAGIWSPTKQSRLVESMLLRIPLPLFYAAEDHEERWAIVDGIQRLSSIARFMRPELVPPTEPLRLRGLEYLKEFEGKTFAELPARLQRRLRETEILIHVIRSRTPDAVKYNIFGRLNTGGEPLTAQELRHALTPGPCRGLLKDWAASDLFVRATSGSVRPQRMADREMVLRFVAFYRTPAEAYAEVDFNDFLLKQMRALNDLPRAEGDQLRDALERALSAALSIFGADAFRKPSVPSYGRLPINKAVFESLSVNLARLSQSRLALAVERAEAVRGAFIEIMRERALDDAVSQGTGDAKKVRLRFRMMREMLESVTA